MTKRELDLNEVRDLAVDAFHKHRGAINDIRRLKADFIRKNPDMNPADQQFNFKGRPVVKECIDDEQVFSRRALLYSNLVIMECLLMEQEQE